MGVPLPLDNSALCCSDCLAIRMKVLLQCTVGCFIYLTSGVHFKVSHPPLDLHLHFVYFTVKRSVSMNELVGTLISLGTVRASILSTPGDSGIPG